MISIRPVGPTDYTLVYQFVSALKEQQLPPAAFAATFEHALQNPNALLLLAYVDAQPAGLITVYMQQLLHHHGPVAEIQELYVQETFRSDGIGAALLHRAEQECIHRGWPEIEVSTNVRRKLAHRFYEKNGYAQTHLKFTKRLQ